MQVRTDMKTRVTHRDRQRERERETETEMAKNKNSSREQYKERHSEVRTPALGATTI